VAWQVRLVQGLFLLWVLFITSGGLACGLVAFKVWKLRKRGRIFHYFGMAKTAIFISTLNSIWNISSLLYMRGLSIFDKLPFSAYRGLICQTLVSGALWLLALFLLDKINGHGKDDK